jgi:hypothetical protein
MVNWAWTGARPPAGGLTLDEVICISLDVTRTVNSGDSIGTGGCAGVDEIVMRTVRLLKEVINLSLITFAADKEPSWPKTRVPPDVIAASDRTVGNMGYLQRDRALVEWANFVRAIPLHPLQRGPSGMIIVTRGSGTAYTAREADSLNKLIAELPLRPAA